jgi:hypothetical protein
MVNSFLKWGVLDRSLADALIYAGSYGEAMQRGIGESLCKIISGFGTSGQPCNWSNRLMPPGGHFVFVTHSLGSRMLYDTLLSLTGGSTQHLGYPTPIFPQNEITQAEPIVRDVVNKTAALYMMANQVAMIGISNVPYDAPLYERQHFVIKAKDYDLTVSQSAAAASDPLLSLLSGRDKNAPILQIVSFNDTNDLLTWHVPAWYEAAADNQMLGVKITDVFVRNAPRWVGAVEWPPSAHGDYFTNLTVWKAILCGAQADHISPNCSN